MGWTTDSTSTASPRRLWSEAQCPDARVSTERNPASAPAHPTSTPRACTTQCTRNQRVKHTPRRPRRATVTPNGLSTIHARTMSTTCAARAGDTTKRPRRGNSGRVQRSGGKVHSAQHARELVRSQHGRAGGEDQSHPASPRRVQRQRRRLPRELQRELEHGPARLFGGREGRVRHAELGQHGLGRSGPRPRGRPSRSRSCSGRGTRPRRGRWGSRPGPRPRRRWSPPSAPPRRGPRTRARPASPSPRGASR